MSIATSIFLIAAGAILRYAIEVDVSGVDIEVIGLILMIAGFAGLAISLFYTLLQNDQRERERERYEQQRYQQGHDPYDRGRR